jgi:AraC family ethanolamine operon transcriptional activator
LSAAEEQLARIAFVAVPAEMILVVLPSGSGSAPPIWGGVGVQAGRIMTLGAGERLHARTAGSCRWGSIWLPATELIRYGSALTGAALSVSSFAQWWRPRPAIGRYLGHLHSAAIRAVEERSRAAINAETAHGLEQQLIDTLVECFSESTSIEIPPVTREYQKIAVRFEALLQIEPERPLRISEISASLGVSTQTLRLCCEVQLGMGPVEYVRRRRMHLAYRALRTGSPDGGNISTIARRYGFRSLGHFITNYRALFGELPSATLRRARDGGMARLALRRRHILL